MRRPPVVLALTGETTLEIDVERFLQGPSWLSSDWARALEVVGPPLVRAFLLGILTWYVAKIARSSFERATRRTRADASLRLVIGRAIYLAILVLGAITVLDVVGVPPSTLITFVGVIGIGISLSLQDILKNFFAGTYLLFERPFRIGDVISVKDHRGVVETVGLRTTTLRTAENVQIMIPNAIVFADVVSNRTFERAPEEAADGSGEEQDAASEAVVAANPPAIRGAAGSTLGVYLRRITRRLRGAPRAWSNRFGV